MRQAARGYDFALRSKPNVAIEVKGIKASSGRIQFTDHEWSVAKELRDDFHLVVVGNLSSVPIAKVYRDPHATIVAECRFTTTMAALWQSRVSVAT